MTEHKREEEEYWNPTEEEFEAAFLEDEEEEGEPPKQRVWIKRVIAFTLSIVLLGNILAFWPNIYSLAAIQFLMTSHELSQSEEIQRYKESVVVVRTDGSKGTGFHMEDGWIVTNDHVVGSAAETIVHFSDGTSYIAEVEQTHADVDLAVMKLKDDDGTEFHDMPGLPLAPEAAIEPGMPIYVIGNPLFFTRIANEGHVMGISGGETPLLLLDAPIYKGNSGSPVLNESGEVIAVVFATTKVDANGKNQKVGLAIPATHVLELWETGR